MHRCARDVVCSYAAMPRGTRARRRRRCSMRKLALVLLALAATASLARAEGRPTRFWNLTRHTISEFYLAPTGTRNWGANQCKNDKDGTVDPDERLRITGVAPGS